MKLPVVSLASLPEPPPDVDPGEWYTLAYAEQLKLQLGLKPTMNLDPVPRGLTQGFLKVQGSTIRVELEPDSHLWALWGHAQVELDSSQLVSLVSLVRRKLNRLHSKPPKDEEVYARQADFLTKLLEALQEGGAAGKLTH